METESLDLLNEYVGTGNTSIFAELVRRHSGMVYGTALRITRNHHDAEDIAQECFVRLASAQNISASLSGWLYGVASNLSKMRIRSRERRTQREQTADMPDEERDVVNWGEIEPFVDAAIEELPEKYREPLVLHFLEQQSQQQIAETLGTSQATVSRNIEKGVSDVRAHLKRRKIVVTVSALAALLTANSGTAAPHSLIAALTRIGIAGVGTAETVPPTASSAGVGKVAVGLGTAAAVLAIAYVVLTDSNAPSPEPESVAPSAGTVIETPADIASLSTDPLPDNETATVIAPQTLTDTGATQEPQTTPIQYDFLVVSGDRDLEWTDQGSGGHFEGTTGDAHWPGNHAILHITNDTRERIELAVDFKARSEADIVIGLSAATKNVKDGTWPLCLVFDKTIGSAAYRLDTTYLKRTAELVTGIAERTASGNEAQTFHELRITLDRASSTISYKVDGSSLGAIRVSETLAPLARVRLTVATPTKDINLSATFTNLQVHSSGAPLDIVGAERHASPTDPTSLITILAKDDPSVTIDTHVRGDKPARIYGDAAELKPDMSVGKRNGVRYALLSFPGLLNKIPEGAVIESAVLALFVVNPGDDVQLHRMLAPWRESASWFSFGSDGPVPGQHFESKIEAVVKGPETVAPLDDGVIVTADISGSLRAWRDGAPNNGWILVSTGQNGTGITSSEYAQPELRPFVMIRFSSQIQQAD